jgi:hypothetical protein
MEGTLLYKMSVGFPLYGGYNSELFMILYFLIRYSGGFKQNLARILASNKQNYYLAQAPPCSLLSDAE